MTPAEQAAAERAEWEQRALDMGVWVLLMPGNRAVLATGYDPDLHGGLAHCWNCKLLTTECSWDDGNREAPGDCCTECQHMQVGP